jgi:hypothetical protein
MYHPIPVPIRYLLAAPRVPRNDPGTGRSGYGVGHELTILSYRYPFCYQCLTANGQLLTVGLPGQGQRLTEKVLAGQV